MIHYMAPYMRRCPNCKVMHHNDDRRSRCFRCEATS